MGIKKYTTRTITIDDLVNLVNEGKGIKEIAEITGKNNKWVKVQLLQHYGSDRFIIKPGRYGGIFLDGKKMNQ